MNKATKLITAGKNYKENFGSVNAPVHRTSTVLFPTMDAYHQAEQGKPYYKIKGNVATDYSYGISGTPTAFALQNAICEIEGAKYCLLYPSGLAAITMSLFALLESGDHVLISDSAYAPTRRFFNKELSRFGVEATYYDPLAGEGIAKHIKKNTKLIFTESPGSLTFEVQDIPAITKIAKSFDIPVIIDNSWATPLYFDPFKHGVDISLQAGTKYIGGHSDVILGVVTTNNDKLYQLLARVRRNYGITVSPDDCYLANRGIRTMGLRLKAHEESALAVAKWLKERPEVKVMLHPAFPSCPGHELWKRDFSGSTGLFSFILDKKYSKEAVANMVDNMKIFGIGASWGGFESLIMPVDPSAIRTASSWPHKSTCIRVYIGLEDVSDIIKDMENGLLRLKEADRGQVI
jgi:cystathionine beta-lyase